LKASTAIDIVEANDITATKSSKMTPRLHVLPTFTCHSRVGLDE